MLFPSVLMLFYTMHLRFLGKPVAGFLTFETRNTLFAHFAYFAYFTHRSIFLYISRCSALRQNILI